ncbi:MAG: lipoate--protein ligase family protein [Burkholderiales bacterium]|nr:lipoate--protein ligase family protein [Anaerolineae bacterium]
MRQWRLMYDLPTIGQRNMAVDEAVLTAVSAGDMPPTLRLYGWWPPCLSLGYAQKATDVDFERLNALGWGVVRRPTGGRAILHVDELTYSVALPIDHPLAEGGIIDSYRRLSEALQAGLVRLGLQSQAERRTERNTNPSVVCFETPSHYEITVGGRKLIGSAQLRRLAGLLQHGTLPLTGDVAGICDVLVYADDAEREAAKSTVRERATTLSEALGVEVSWEQAAEAVAEGFAETFGLEFSVGGLSHREEGHAEKLQHEVYNSIERPARVK